MNENTTGSNPTPPAVYCTLCGQHHPYASTGCPYQGGESSARLSPYQMAALVEKIRRA